MMILALRSPSFLPSSWAGFLFETHWMMWVALAVLGGIVLLISRGRADRRLRWAGLGVLLAAALWVGAAYLVDSPGERLRAAHVGLAKAAEKHDVEGMLSYCRPDFSVPQLGIKPGTSDARVEIRKRIEEAGIKETTFTRMETTQNGDSTAVTRFVALTQSELGLIQTTWEVLWEDVPGQDWRISSATLLKVGDQPVGSGEIVK